MTARKRRWLAALAALGVLTIAGLFVAASILARRFEPYIREQAIEYLRNRFDANVEIASLHVRLPNTSPARLLLTRGRGALAHVEGEGISLRFNGRRDVPPLFTMKKFGFDVDLGTLFASPKQVPLVTLDGVEINIPPRRGEPDAEPAGSASNPRDTPSPVVIGRVRLTNATLRMLPADPSKVPLRFHIARLDLQSVGLHKAMKYDAQLTNPKPPGQIVSGGTFGPWAANEPGDTPLSGDYTFSNADLAIFRGIAGTLQSTGRFEGTLDAIHARGEARVPDFRLKMSGNPVPLWTRFEVLVDGTNGNTHLKPVIARLGSTDFTTSGAVIKHEGDRRRSIQLDAFMPAGDMRDVLRLAMKGAPFMEGRLFLKTKIGIPPLEGKVRDKLVLDGRFAVSDGHFLRSRIQDHIDSFSRRAQGEPKNEGIDEVISHMAGAFHLEDEVIRFRNLDFGIPGAEVALNGTYDLAGDGIDFRGTLRMRARLSQTMTGWKRWVLKPVDPFFSKDGAGTLLRIKIDGTAKEPKFGLDRGEKRT